ncbi:hypothetical protein [Amycolatopsis palatopharyngis]|nr:hypothetical protein [Amycolatopsis palatopharyngis]
MASDVHWPITNLRVVLGMSAYDRPLVVTDAVEGLAGMPTDHGPPG